MPLVGARAQVIGDVILLRGVRVANHLELLTIVANNDAAECKGGRLMTEMAADIADAETTLRARIVVMWTNKAGQGLCMSLIPAGAFSLVVGCRCSRIEVEGEDQIGVSDGSVWD